jgi:hypothetical protein
MISNTRNRLGGFFFVALATALLSFSIFAIAANAQVSSIALSRAILSPSQLTVGYNQSVTQNVSWSGGTAPFTIKLYAFTTLTSGCKTGSFVLNYTSSANNDTLGPFNPSFLLPNDANPSSPVKYYYCALIIDSASTHIWAGPSLITINPAPTITITTPPATIDAGQSITFTNSSTGTGTPTYTYSYSTDGGSTYQSVGDSNVSRSANELTFLTGGSYLVTENVSDGLDSVASAPVAIMVNPRITIASPTASPHVDTNQAITLFANGISGGNGHYTTEQWYDAGTTNTNSSGTPVASGLNTTDTQSAQGTYYYYLTVSDGNSTTAAITPPLPVNVSNPSISITPSETSINVGGNVTFTKTTTGGTLPYSFNYSVNNTSGVTNGVTISNNTITFANTGIYNVTESLTDNTGITANSPTVTIVVSAPAPQPQAVPQPFTGGLPPATTTTIAPTPINTTVPVTTTTPTTVTTTPPTTTVPASTGSGVPQTPPSSTVTPPPSNTNKYVGGALIVLAGILMVLFYAYHSNRRRKKG